MAQSWLNAITWNAQGLVAVTTQDYRSKAVLMQAWMNKEALLKTLECGQAVYWSRSRACLWHKGEQSGHWQKVKDIYLDCDGDSLLLLVEPVGNIACHTGRYSCFYRQLANQQWHINDTKSK